MPVPFDPLPASFRAMIASSVTAGIAPLAPLALSIGAIASTLTGGTFALRLRKHMPLVLAFTTGVVLGVVCFDLLPEIFELTHDHGFHPVPPMAALVVAFLFFRIMEELILARKRGALVADEPDIRLRPERRHPRAGQLAALALIGHSTFDGVSIGLAFQISSGIGLVVAAAVIAHDFADGINTVGVMVAHGNRAKHATLMLVADAVAPIVGASSTFLFHFDPKWLVRFLGFFAGFLLHVATSASHTIAPDLSRRRVAALLGITVLGVTFALIVTRLAR